MRKHATGSAGWRVLPGPVGRVARGPCVPGVTRVSERPAWARRRSCFVPPRGVRRGDEAAACAVGTGVRSRETRGGALGGDLARHRGVERGRGRLATGAGPETGRRHALNEFCCSESHAGLACVERAEHPCRGVERGETLGLGGCR